MSSSTLPESSLAFVCGKLNSKNGQLHRILELLHVKSPALVGVENLPDVIHGAFFFLRLKFLPHVHHALHNRFNHRSKLLLVDRSATVLVNLLELIDHHLLKVSFLHPEDFECLIKLSLVELGLCAFSILGLLLLSCIRCKLDSEDAKLQSVFELLHVQRPALIGIENLPHIINSTFFLFWLKLLPHIHHSLHNPLHDRSELLLINRSAAVFVHPLKLVGYRLFEVGFCNSDDFQGLVEFLLVKFRKTHFLGVGGRGRVRSA
mmetsp:Transcript_1007/g.1416  ORF Transcript_1007/g.1416 Transcript_1007/m.1416 type:complete len:262 (+) Transcript_1007:172-957(+)